MKFALKTNHHFDLRYIFTPFAICSWDIKGKTVKMVYIFGIRIARIHI